MLFRSTNVNQLVLEGLFGSVHRVTTTQELIQSKVLADLKIKSLMLKYPDDVCKAIANRKPRMTYKDELAFLIKYKPRTEFIAKLTASLQGNSLVLFNFIAHGRDIFDAIKQIAPQREVFFVYGGVEGEDREAIRHYVENNPNVIVVASYKTFSTGINIKNLHNVVFGSPSKSRIRVFQSIGRGLRVSDQKTQATLYDIADNLSWKSYTNTTLQHAIDRIRMYGEEHFTYKMYTIQLKDDK